MVFETSTQNFYAWKLANYIWVEYASIILGMIVVGKRKALCQSIIGENFGIIEETSSKFQLQQHEGINSSKIHLAG